MAAFAAELRKVQQDAESPTFTALHRKVVQQHTGTGRPVSRTALTEAVGGDHLPTWRTVDAFLRACGQDPRQWVARWERAQDELQGEVPFTDPEGGEAPDAAVGTKPKGADEAGEPEGEGSPARGFLRPPPQRRRRLALPLVVFLLLAAVGAGAWLLTSAGDGASSAVNGAQAGTRGPSGAPSAPAAGGRVVGEGQNKYATGPDLLVEDDTPAYLTTKPVARCYKRGCIVPGTKTLWSGSRVTASCQVRDGDSISNADETTTGIQQNPGRASSPRWYWVTMTGGRSGFIPEVWLTPASRGGRGLPDCNGTQPASTASR